MRQREVPQHYPALDGLRGLAVILVILHHWVTAFSIPGWGYSLLHRSADFMWVGVDLFFVLSGFLITTRLLHSRGKQHYFRNFYIRRTLRIFPLYFAVLILCLVLIPQIFHPPVPVAEGPWLYGFAANIRIAMIGSIHPALNANWSLASEEQFYLLWPLLILLTPPRLAPWLIGALVVLGLLLRYVLLSHGAPYYAIFMLLPTHADGLLVGALLAVWQMMKGQRTMPKWLSGIPVLTFLALLVILPGFYRLGLGAEYFRWSRLEATFNYLFIAAGFGLVLQASISTSNPIERLFTNRILTTAGKYSYAMYLLHQLVPPMSSAVREWLHLPMLFDPGVVANKYARVLRLSRSCDVRSRGRELEAHRAAVPIAQAAPAICCECGMRPLKRSRRILDQRSGDHHALDLACAFTDGE